VSARAQQAWLAFALLAFLALVAPGGVVAAPADSAFPEYGSLSGHVTFWTRVFAEWRLGQVAIHDTDTPAVVYEVLELPGSVGDRYTEAQRDLIKQTRERWEDRLASLERKVDARAPLTDPEKELALKITTRAGTNAIAGARKRVRAQRGLRERFLRGVEIGSRYDAIFREIFRDAGLPEELVALPHVESSFQAAARSSAGAVGIWQFTRGTGRQFMTITSAVDERLDPIAAARGAARYLAQAYEMLPSWPIALTSYNHGVGGMLQAVEEHGVDYETIFHEYEGRLFGFASRNFYSEFLAALAISEDPERYFPEGFTPEPPLDLASISLDHRTTPARVAEVYGVPLDELAALNPAWSRRAVNKGLSLPADVTIWLPNEAVERVAAGGTTPDLSVASVSGSHVVRRGDTLIDIAHKYDMSIIALRELNGLTTHQSLIRVGQKLLVTSSGDLGSYVVQRGDTLSDIARTFGMSLTELREVNNMPAGRSRIYVGQALMVTEAARGVHVVRSGDTLSRIASNYHVPLSDLLQVNRLGLSALIHPGQTLRIPARQ